MVFGLPETISHRMHGNGQYVPTNLTMKINDFLGKYIPFRLMGIRHGWHFHEKKMMGLPNEYLVADGN